MQNKKTVFTSLMAGISFAVLSVGCYSNQNGSSKRDLTPQIDSLISRYELNKKVKPLKLGSKFNFDILEKFPSSGKIDRTKPTLVTFTRSTSSSSQNLHKSLPKGIQKIHVIYSQSYLTSGKSSGLNKRNLEKFGDDVVFVFVNAVSDGKAEQKIHHEDAANLLYSLGVYESGYAYLIDEEQNLIFQDNAIGLDQSQALLAAQNYLQNKPMPKSREHLVSSEPLKNPFLDQKTKEIWKEYTNSDQVVMIISAQECSLCSMSQEKKQKYINKWTRQGVKVVKLSLSEKGEAEEVIDQKGNFLEIKTKLSDHIFRTLNTRGFPSHYVAKNGKYIGKVPYISWDFNGDKYNDLQYEALDKILNF